MSRALIDALERLMLDHVAGQGPFLIDLPPDLDAAHRDLLIAEAAKHDGVIICDAGTRDDVLRRVMESNSRIEALTTFAQRVDAAAEWDADPFAYPPGLTRWPTSPPKRPTAPKPPRGSCVVQDARIAKAEARRERVRARNLKNLEQR